MAALYHQQKTCLGIFTITHGVDGKFVITH